MQLVQFHRQQCRAGAGVTLCAMLVIGAPSLGSAQEPVPGSPHPPPTPGPATAIAAYRPPALALVQPAAGGSVPQDRPVVVFRFAPGEPNDPVDTRSFTVTVGGADRGAAFQVTAGEAWGTMADPEDAAFLAGAHQVTARLCSARGACTEMTTTVTVVPSAAPPQETTQEQRRKRLIAKLLDAVRSLFTP